MKKVLKVILIIVVIIIAIFLLHIIRNCIIMSKLQSKVQEKMSENNFYVKMQFNSLEENIIHSTELYKKDSNMKHIVTINTKNVNNLGNFTQKSVSYKKGSTVTRFIDYVEDGNEKKRMYEETIEEKEDLINIGGLFDLISNGVDNRIFSFIKSEKVNNRDCYVIICNSDNYSVGGDFVKMYIDKESALPVQIVEPSNNKNGVTYFEYKFGTVTDEDFEFPDTTQYEKGE